MIATYDTRFAAYTTEPCSGSLCAISDTSGGSEFATYPGGAVMSPRVIVPVVGKSGIRHACRS